MCVTIICDCDRPPRASRTMSTPRKNRRAWCGCHEPTTSQRRNQQLASTWTRTDELNAAQRQQRLVLPRRKKKVPKTSTPRGWTRNPKDGNDRRPHEGQRFVRHRRDFRSSLPMRSGRASKDPGFPGPEPAEFATKTWDDPEGLLGRQTGRTMRRSPAKSLPIIEITSSLIVEENRNEPTTASRRTSDRPMVA